MREVKEWILSNEACAALNWRDRKMSILEKIIARFRWFTLLSQLYGWFILVFFLSFFFNLTWWVRAVLADGLLVVYALQAGGELQGGRLRIKIVVEWLLSNVEWCALCFSQASIARHRDWICVCCEDCRDWPASKQNENAALVSTLLGKLASLPTEVSPTGQNPQEKEHFYLHNFRTFWKQYFLLV